MKTRIIQTLGTLALFVSLHQAIAQGTAFTYQGRLSNGTNPANGSYDLQFTLFGSSSDGVAVAGPITNAITTDSNGLFTTALDYGSAPFDGSSRWLETGVRTNGAGTFATLNPRQQLTPTPYALYAPIAGVANNVYSSGSVQAQTLNIGLGNTASGTFTTIAGGSSNAVNANFAVVAGGLQNMASSNSATIGGGSANTASGDHGTVSGGEGNTASGNHAFVGGGIGNIASSDEDVVVGGKANIVAGDPSFIGSGEGNKIGAISQNPNSYTIIKGSADSWIAAGKTNQVLANYSGIGGGAHNTLQSNADYSFIGGGAWNIVQSFATESTISGGATNRIQSWANDVTIGGGENNLVEFYANDSTISGGNNNYIGDHAQYSTISGGIDNLIYSGASRSIIGGGDSNYIHTNQTWATIGGGYGNNIGIGNFSTNQYYTDGFSTVGGGHGNYIYSGADHSTISGGDGNWIMGNSFDGTIGGGASNYIETNSVEATIAGGYANVIKTNSGASTIGGGQFNVASNSYSTVPGGYSNQALAKFSFAAGDQAIVNVTNPGTFVWADSTPDVNFGPFASTAPDQFLIRANGGVGIGTTAPGAGLDVAPSTFGTAIRGTSIGTGVYGSSTANSSSGYGVYGHGPYGVYGFSSLNTGIGVYGTSSSGEGVHGVSSSGNGVYGGNTGAGNSGTGVTGFSQNGYGIRGTGGNIGVYAKNLISGTVAYLATPALAADLYGDVHVSGDVYAGGVKLTSDRNSKENFIAINGRDVLTKVALLPVMEWNYKTDSKDVQHLGPTAQDFQAAFRLDGMDDKHISVIDEGGVALAAIQGLNQKVDEKNAELQNLKQQNKSLEKRLNELQQMVQSLVEKK